MRHRGPAYGHDQLSVLPSITPQWTPERLLAASPDGVVLVDGAGCVVGVNPRAASLIGASPGDLLGRPAREALPLTDGAGRDWWAVTDPWGGLAIRTGHRERRLHVDGGRSLLVSMRYLRAGRSAPVQFVVVALRDARSLDAETAAGAGLVTLAAHELRAPLASVRTFSANLRRHWDTYSDAERRDLLCAIEADADRLGLLVQDLLDCARLDTSRVRVDPRPVALAPVVADRVHRVVVGGEPAERFVVDVPDDVGVLADRARIDQILANLLENAIKHGRGAITLTARDDGCGLVTLDVDDEGDGIPAAVRGKVFEKYWHGGHPDSTGLGLYLVRGLVLAHGGDVRAGQAPGGGARIRVTLPSATPEG